ncbi:MAG: glycosyltransferase family 4 protein [Gemmatimonadota bacterium]
MAAASRGVAGSALQEPKRILYVEPNEDGTVGGSHKILYDLVVRLSPNFHATVLFYQDNIWADRLKERGFDVLTWDDIRSGELRGLKSGGKVSTGLALAGAIRRRRQLLREGHFDMVHLNNSPFVGYDDWLPAARLVGVPCVTYKMGNDRAPKDAIEAFAIRQFDAYFALSRIMQRSLERNGVPPEKIELTYPGIDFDEVDCAEYRPAEEVRAEFGVQPGQLVVVMVGNIRQWKGQHVVVEALAQLEAEERAALRLLFVGDTDEGSMDYRAGLEESIRSAGLEDTAIFTGRREDVPHILEAGDIAIHASVIPEPFGLVVQEAMLHGCATVAADQGGPVEMITEESGITFNPADPGELTRALRTLIHDEGLRKRLSQNGRLRARAYDLGAHVRGIERRYASILGL